MNHNLNYLSLSSKTYTSYCKLLEEQAPLHDYSGKIYKYTPMCSVNQKIHVFFEDKVPVSIRYLEREIGTGKDITISANRNGNDTNANQNGGSFIIDGKFTNFCQNSSNFVLELSMDYTELGISYTAIVFVYGKKVGNFSYHN